MKDSSQKWELNEKELALHRSCIVVDTHNDTIQDIMSGSIPHSLEYAVKRRLGERSTEGQIDLPRIRDGGVDCLFFALVVSRGMYRGRRLRRLLQMLDVFYTQVEENPNDIALATTHNQVIQTVNQGKVAAILSIEGGEALEGDLGMLRMLYKLGIRSMTLTHFARNELGDGSRDDAGSHLTEFGSAVVDEMNRLGMIVDVSHLNETGFWDVLEKSTKPVIASHSNCKALSNYHRNLTDQQIKAIGDNGGVLNLSYCAEFIKHVETREDLAKITISDWIKHVDHAVKLVGPEHIGLGSDFDGGCGFPEMNDISTVPRITKALLTRGYTDEDVTKILGENNLRVMKEVLR